MPRTRSKPSAVVSTDDRIIADLRCIKCGFALRGCELYAPCPQCSHPASDSVYGDYLIYADRSELRRLEDAAGMVIAGATLTATISLVILLTSLFGAASVIQGVILAFEAMWVGALIFPVVAATGVFLLTRRHTPEYYKVRYLNNRFMTRAALFAVAAIVLIGVALYFYRDIVESLMLTVWATLPTVVFLRGLADLMQRLPNLKLARMSRGVLAASVTLGCITVIVLLIRPYAANNTDLRGLLTALMIFAICGGIGIGIAGFRLLLLSRDTIRAVR